MDSEPDLVRKPGEMEPDMTRADHVQLRRRFDWLDVDVHLPAADQPRFLREVVGQLVVHDLGPAARNRLTRLPERVVFVAAAADGAHGAAVGEDHHFGADALRRRPGGGHDRHQRRRLAALQRVDDRGEDFAIHL